MVLLSAARALPCSPLAAGSKQAAARRQRLCVVRAQEGGGAPTPPEQQQQEQQQQQDERRLEALEAAARARKGVKAEQADAFRGSPAARRAMEAAAGNMPEWKEGQLFPEGWEDMNPLEKANQLYMGQRGFLFWANKAALWSVGLLFGSWVVFRFIGPALGLYKLTNDLSTPNFL